ncbi:MAG: uroporphyrinogen-III synthase [Marivita sp.]|uniref:uroporphyrinogen-III synthase n=1 Tax=Marivita sp. TaxID=2003365 RepID=UPI003EFA9397
MLLTTTRDAMVLRRPLLLLTRPKPSSDAFWDALPEDVRAAVDFLINPLLSIKVTGPLPSLEGTAGLIFTSANGLDAYKVLGGPLLSVPVIAVGASTGEAARAFGFDTDVSGGTADQLVRHVLDRGYCGPLLHVRGENAIGDIAERLTEAGVATSDVVVYDQVLEPFARDTREALSQDRPVLAPVFSARTAQQLGRESAGLGDIRFAAISRAVAGALPLAAQNETRIAKTPDRGGMIELIVEMVTDATNLERRT